MSWAGLAQAGLQQRKAAINAAKIKYLEMPETSKKP
jgi:hypothetical protein